MSDDLYSRVLGSVESGQISADALPQCASAPVADALASAERASSPCDGARDFDPKKALERSMHLLADSLKNDSRLVDVKTMFSYDGGLEISYFGSWSSGAFLSALKPLKVLARENNGVVPLVFHGLAVWVHPEGARSGCGSYSYVVHVEEDGRSKYTLLLHTSPCDSIPGVRVIAHYQAFRGGRDVLNFANDVKNILECIEFNVDRSTLSRIDFNLTVTQDMSALNDAFFEDRIINRCRDASLVGGRKFHSYRIGSSKLVQFAVYDKALEQTEKLDSDKASDLIAAFPDLGDKPLTRYEFRLGRKFLHSIQVDTIDDYIEREIEIINYLVFDWFVINNRTYRNGKKENLDIAPWWKFIASSFMISALCKRYNLLEDDTLSQTPLLNIIGRCRNLIGFVPKLRRAPARRFRRGIKRLFSTGVGCLVSALVLSGSPTAPLDQVNFKDCLVKVSKFLSDDAFVQYKKRFNQYQDLPRLYQNLTVVES